MRTTLVLFTLLCFQLAVLAQKNQSFGISYAPTLARINDFSGKATGPRYGQQACLIFQWKTSSTFSYRIGLGYSYLQAAKSYNQLFTNDQVTTWSRVVGDMVFVLGGALPIAYFMVTRLFSLR